MTQTHDFTDGFIKGAKVESESIRAWLICHGYNGPFWDSPEHEILAAAHCACHDPQSPHYGGKQTASVPIQGQK